MADIIDYDKDSKKEEKVGESIDDKVDTVKYDAGSLSSNSAQPEPAYVVGIGASAGGLEALEALFSKMPLQTGMAFVIIQHLSPDYKSMMDELLARKTMIPIRVAEDRMVLEPDTIYLLPPKKEMITASGKLYLTERENDDMVNLPINTFFRSMAESYRDKCIAIILSGTGSDGSKSVPLVHDSGGFVIAQSPESCKFSAMPENAISTNNVDLILGVEDIPASLVKYSQRIANVQQHLILKEFDSEVSEFSEILLLLNNRFNLDFSQYKPSTISRRLERRISYQKTSSLRDYLDVLLSNHDELESLYFDLLIGVTRFFRDSVAFNSLRTVLPKLLIAFKNEPEIRVWVAGCATGQEAYSTAMLLSEEMENHEYGAKPFKIFATDIHSSSIQTAAAGVYNDVDLEEMSEPQRERFFTKLGSGLWQVNQDIRKRIIFAQHNLLKDPPFTRTHLISCRNLLIYFNNSAQQRVLSLLTFSLMNRGLLFLGPSEAIGNHSSDYEAVDATYRIFRKTRDGRGKPDIPLTMRTQKQSGLQRLGSGEMLRQDGVLVSAKSRRAMEVLLQKYVPPSLLVDDQGTVLHVFGDAGQFLSMNFGAASLNLTALVSGPAKTVITQMLNRINKTLEPVKSNGVSGFVGRENVDIEMQLLSEMPGDQSYILVSFQNTLKVLTEVDKKVKAAQTVISEVVPDADDSRIRDLEVELQYTKENLQSTVEELETSNEELQASNEELMASNEELQSTNEELQSVNEELFTVNSEFQQKELERSELLADERSIIEESNIGIMFLDESLRVRKMSPAAASLFNLIDTDYGRPFSAASGKLVKGIAGDIHKVYQGGELVEKEVEDENGATYLMRINSYARSEVEEDRAQDDDSARNGVVLTFADITKYRVLKDSMAKNQTRFDNIINSISDGYFEWNIKTNECYFSRQFLRSLGYEDEMADMEKLLSEQSKILKEKIRRAGEHGLHVEEVLPFVKSDQSVRWMICKGSCLRDQASEKFSGILIDFSKQKDVENELHRHAVDLERSNKLLAQFAYMVSHDLKAPLRHIHIYLDFLKTAVENEDKEAIHSEMMSLNESANGLDQLIDDVIMYSRLSSEKATFALVNVDSVIDTALASLSHQVSEKNVSIRRSVVSDVYADEGLLSHLIQNLIDNAIKYNDKSVPVVEIHGETEDGVWLMHIVDNGIGFDESLAESIFKPFHRLVTKEEYDGSGVGLSICKAIVDMHCGEIVVKSTKGQGSEFTVKLPLTLGSN
jgi:two-component system CheB/CheR fusion protein